MWYRDEGASVFLVSKIHCEIPSWGVNAWCSGWFASLLLDARAVKELVELYFWNFPITVGNTDMSLEFSIKGFSVSWGLLLCVVTKKVQPWRVCDFS